MNRYLIVLVIFLTMPLNGFGIDIYVPSLPIIREYFNSNAEMVQLTIGAYLLGFALIQLIIGVVCDSIGRRKPYIYALSTYIVATILIVMIHDVLYLLILRFIQGLAVGTFVVACRAILVDLFSGKALLKIASYLAIAFAMAPIIAPVIGGYLQQYFNWQANFYFLCLYAILCLTLFYFYVPETLVVKRKLNLNNLLTAYKIVFTNLEFWLCTFVLGFIYASLILFNVVAPFIIEDILHYSVVEFGYIALIIGLMWFLGTISNKILHRISKNTKAKYGFLVMFISVSIMLFLAWQFTNLYAIIIPTGIIFYLGGFLFSTYYARNMSILPSSIAATSGSLMGATTVVCGAVCGSFLGSQLKSNSAVSLSSGLMVLIIVCCIIYTIESKYINNRSKH